MRLDKFDKMVFLYAMTAAIASDEIPDIQTQAHEITRRQLQEWFVWMDRILNVHRSNFIFRAPTAVALAEHKTALKAASTLCVIARRSWSSMVSPSRPWT